MLDALLSVASGGLLGLVGTGITKFMGWKEKKLQLEHEVVMAAEDRLSMEMEITLAKTRGSIDLELQDNANDSTNLQTAINAEAAITGTSQWVADLRGSVRPILTYLLVFFAVGMAVWAAETNPYTNKIIFMAMTAVTFWYGSRPPSTK